MIQICVWDWDQADVRTQGLKNDDDQVYDDQWMIVDTFASSGRDVAEASNQQDDDEDAE